MTQVDAELRALADAFGVATEFWDWRGQHVDVPVDTLVAVLGALGVDASSPQACTEELVKQQQKPLRTMLPPAESSIPRAAGRPAPSI